MSLALSILLSCAPPDSSASAQEDTAADGSDDTSAEPGYFLPAAVLIRESWLPTDGLTLVSAAWPDGESLTPRLRLLFAAEDFFIDPTSPMQCDWWGELQGFEPAAPGDGRWLQGTASLSLLTTDCEGFDPAVWEGGTPTQALEALTLEVGIGPLGNLAMILPDYYENQGLDYDADAPFLVSAFLAIGDGPLLEYAYGVVYQTDGADQLQTDEDGGLVPLEQTGEPPSGVFYGIPFEVMLPEDLR